METFWESPEIPRKPAGKSLAELGGLLENLLGNPWLGWEVYWEAELGNLLRNLLGRIQGSNSLSGRQGPAQLVLLLVEAAEGHDCLNEE